MADDPRIQTQLPENAYRELKPGETYVPMVPPDVQAPEITMRSILFGILMNIMFSMAATYLALKVGQGIETAIPISILAVGLSGFLMKMGLRRSTIIENINILAISTTSGIVAGGTVFTMPAIYLLKLNTSLNIGNGMLFLAIFLVPLLGTILGVIFLVPFRRYFVKEMHGKLPFPEGTATNEILVTGSGGGKNAFILIYSFLVASAYTVMTAALKLWPEDFTTGKLHVDFTEKAKAGGEAVTHALHPLAFTSLSDLTEKVKAVFSFGTGAEFLGLGFIIGVRYASIICAGSFLSWFVIIPLLAPLDVNGLQKLNSACTAHDGAYEKTHALMLDMSAAATLDAMSAGTVSDEDMASLTATLKGHFEGGNRPLVESPTATVSVAKNAETGFWKVKDKSSSYEIRPMDENPGNLGVFASTASASEIFTPIPRNIGIGCIFAAGLLSILKMGKVIVTALKEAMGSLFRKKSADASATDRTDQDISYPMLFIIGILVTVGIFIFFKTFVMSGMEDSLWLTIVSVLLALFVSFVFITVSAWAIATISVTPISGMTVTTIIITAVVLLKAGLPRGDQGMLAVLLVGGVVAAALSMAGTLVTEFKLGYWAGASPRRIQWSAIIACVMASAIVTGTIMLLAQDPGYDPTVSKDALQAPQANLMKSALQSFIGTGEVPWLVYIVGVVLALVLELVGISPLAFGLGMYLPMSLNVPILVGAIVSAMVKKGGSEKLSKARSDKGILIASGFVAGAAIIGVLLRGIGVFAPGFMSKLDIPSRFVSSSESAVSIARYTNILGIVAFLLLCAFVYWDSRRAKVEE